jgi:uncharacterized membrane protein YfcA
VSGAEVVLVAVAGLLCGAVNALAGGGSLILFPALVATGMGTLPANVTNAVSTWPGYVGSLHGFRAEVEEQRHHLPRLGVASAVGALVGSGLLLVTPSDAFDQVVPLLVLAAAVLLAVQPRIARRIGSPRHRPDARHHGREISVALASVYGGYFGAALGVILLGVLGLTIDASLRRLNGLKAAISLVVASVTLVVFALFGPVQWSAVAVAAPATLVGGYLGARASRRVPDTVLRAAVVVLAVGVSIVLAARAWSP